MRLALPGEVGVEVEAVAHVHDEEEGRAHMLRRQRTDVALRLVLRLRHRLLPTARAAPGGACLPLRLLRAETFGLRLLGRVGPLFGLQHERAALVEVDEAAVAASELDGPLEGVVVVLVQALGRFGPGQIQEVAQLGEEEGGVSALGSTGGFPALGEGADGRRVGHRSRGGTSEWKHKKRTRTASGKRCALHGVTVLAWGCR